MLLLQGLFFANKILRSILIDAPTSSELLPNQGPDDMESMSDYEEFDFISVAARPSELTNSFRYEATPLISDPGYDFEQSIYKQTMAESLDWMDRNVSNDLKHKSNGGKKLAKMEWNNFKSEKADDMFDELGGEEKLDSLLEELGQDEFSDFWIDMLSANCQDATSVPDDQLSMEKDGIEAISLPFTNIDPSTAPLYGKVAAHMLEVKEKYNLTDEQLMQVLDQFLETAIVVKFISPNEMI